MDLNLLKLREKLEQREKCPNLELLFVFSPNAENTDRPEKL